jgi:surfeit locus 1 family protein
VSRATAVFLVLAAAAAAVCVRLGVWQLDRLQQRRAANALVAARLDSAEVGPERLPADTALVRYRRVRLRGTYDFDHEIVLAGRSRQGSPGVNFLTPLRLAGSDTAVLVNRGWVYSPNAAGVDATRWREAGEATVTGFATTFHEPAAGRARLAERTVRRLDAAVLDSLVPYPLAAYYVTATSPAAFPDSAPVRLMPPPLDEGSHLSYAFQWFSFATIAVAGAGIVWWKGRGRA